MRQKIKKDLREEFRYITIETNTNFTHIPDLPINQRRIIGRSSYFSLDINRRASNATLSAIFHIRLQIVLLPTVNHWSKEMQTI